MVQLLELQRLVDLAPAFGVPTTQAGLLYTTSQAEATKETSDRVADKKGAADGRSTHKPGRRALLTWASATLVTLKLAHGATEDVAGILSNVAEISGYIDAGELKATWRSIDPVSPKGLEGRKPRPQIAPPKGNSKDAPEQPT